MQLKSALVTAQAAVAAAEEAARAAVLCEEDATSGVAALKAALASAQKAYKYHPAIKKAAAERRGRLAAEAAYHAVLRQLIPHQHAAAEAHQWKEEVMAAAKAAEQKAAAREASLREQEVLAQKQKAAFRDARQRAQSHGEAAAELQLQVRLG